MKLFKILKKHLVFGFVFSVSKAIVYFTPLLLADVLSKNDFGILEYALAGLGMIVNTVINLGVPGAYPYFMLKKRSNYEEDGFKLHAMVLIIPFLLNQIAFFFLGLDLSFYFAFNVSYIIANQIFYSTQLKSHEKSIFAVILDSGIYICLLLLLGFSIVSNEQITIQSISNMVIIYSLCYVGYAVYQFISADKMGMQKKYQTILKFGFHLLISTFLIFLITTSGRILVELFFDFEKVGVYAFYYRLAAIVVMVHQIVNITYFKKIYTLDPRTLDKYFCLFYLFIFILSLGVFYISPYVLKHFSTFFVETYDQNQSVFFVLSAQMVMWIATALNFNIISRENLAPHNNIGLTILVILSGVLMLRFGGQKDLAFLTFLHFTVIYLTTLIQGYSMIKQKIYFNKSLISLTIIYIFTTSIYFLIY